MNDRTVVKSSCLASSEWRHVGPCVMEPMEGRVFLSADSFEPDNSASAAKAISAVGVAQVHTLHTTSDVDWMKFTLTGTLKASVFAYSCQKVKVELFGPNSSTKLVTSGTTDPAGLYLRLNRSLAKGTYYIKAARNGTSAAEPRYTIRVDAGAYETQAVFCLNARHTAKFSGTQGGKTATQSMSVLSTGNGGGSVVLGTTLKSGSTTTAYSSTYTTSTGDGLKISSYTTDTETPYACQKTFAAPILVLPEFVQIGTTYSFSGGYSGKVLAPGPHLMESFTGTMTGTAKPLKTETITTPLGTFTCLKVSMSVKVTDKGKNWSSTHTENQTIWLDTKGKGIIRRDGNWTGTTGTGSYTYKLTEYKAL